MEQVNNQLFDFFKKNITDEMKVESYLKIFLSTFLGTQYFRKSFSDKNSFVKYCKNIVDNTSLCRQEIKFFHSIIDLVNNDNITIQMFIDEYHNIKKLEKCQLGNLILRCLNESKHVVLI